MVITELALLHTRIGFNRCSDPALMTIVSLLLPLWTELSWGRVTELQLHTGLGLSYSAWVLELTWLV